VPNDLNCGSTKKKPLRETVEALEDHIKDRHYENAYIIDSRTGEVLSYSAGDRFSVDIDEPESIYGNVVTHNHPPITDDRQSELYKGQSLSHQDVMMASAYNAKEIRAVTNTYRHSMKPKTKWPSVDNLQHSYTRHYSETITDLRRGIVSGNYTHDQANAMLWHEINKRVAKEHNMVYSRTTLKGVRADRAAVRCSPKSKRCGNTCVPIRYKCKSSLSQFSPNETDEFSDNTSVDAGSSSESRRPTYNEPPEGRNNESSQRTLTSLVSQKKETGVDWTAVGAASSGAIGMVGVGAAVWAYGEMGKAATDPNKFEFPSDEHELSKAEELYSKFQPGDLVHRAFPTAGKHYEHYAIYAGRGEDGSHEFYEVGTPTPEGMDPSVRKNKVRDKVGISFFQKVPPTEMYQKGGQRFSPEEIIKRAKLLEGHVLDYKVSQENCESWARMIVEDVPYTNQGKHTHRFVKSATDIVSNLYSVRGEKREKAVNLSQMLDQLNRESAKWKKASAFADESLFTEDSRKDAFSSPVKGLVDPKEFARRVEKVAKGSMANHIRAMLYSNYFQVLLASRQGIKKAEKRTDAVRCSPGNKPCGKICVPQKYKCKNGSVGASLEQDEQGSASIQSRQSLSHPVAMASAAVAPGLKIAAWGLAGSASVGAAAMGSVLADIRQNVEYKGEIPRIPPNGEPDAQTMANYDTFKAGDVVMRTFKTPVGTFQHYALYAGKENGQHYFYSQDANLVYQKEPGNLKKPPTTSEYVKVNDQYTQHSPVSRQKALRRAELMLGTALEHSYGHTQGDLGSTCESISRGLANDDWKTRQNRGTNWLTNAVLPVLSKAANRAMDAKQGKAFRMTDVEMQRFLEKREGGADFEMAKKDILEFRSRKEKRGDSAEDDFFSMTGLMTPDEFQEYASSELGKIPGFVGDRSFEKLLAKYLKAIISASRLMISLNNHQEKVKKDSLDPASAAIAKKQLAAVVFRVISRSYKEKIDRFLTLDISATDIITGTVLSKGSIVLFTINLAKKTVETRIIKEGRKDSIRNDRLYRRLKRSKCNTGLSCGSTCISRSAACRLGLNQVASAGETRQMQQLTIALNEDKNPSVEEESIRDLRKRASDLGIHKYSRMSKSEMISTINAMESGSAERERLSRSLEKKYEAERFTRSNALSDYAQDWNKAKKIMAIAGSGGAFTLAAAALYFYGRARSEIKKDIDNYRSAFPSMAQQAMAEEKKLRHDQVVSPDHEGVIFAVGGYKGEGSSGDAIRGQLIVNGKVNPSEFDKWVAEKHEIRAVNLSKDYPPFEGSKMTSDGKYTVEYLGYLTKNGIEGRLGDKGLLGRAFAGLTDQEKEVPRNQDAITLAAQIYAVAKSKRPGYKELDKMSEEDISSEFKTVFGVDPPSGVKPGSLRSALGQMREARGENSFYANANKSISILAHGQGGGTAREALEILHLMDGGAEVASRVKLITMSSPRMGLTQKRAGAEWNLTSKDDPLNEFQTQATSVNTVKNREVTSYLRDSNVRTMIAENLGFMRYGEKQEAIMSLQGSLLRDLAKQAEKARKKAKKPKEE